MYFCSSSLSLSIYRSIYLSIYLFISPFLSVYLSIYVCCSASPSVSDLNLVLIFLHAHSRSLNCSSGTLVGIFLVYEATVKTTRRFGRNTFPENPCNVHFLNWHLASVHPATHGVRLSSHVVNYGSIVALKSAPKLRSRPLHNSQIDPRPIARHCGIVSLKVLHCTCPIGHYSTTRTVDHLKGSGKEGGL